MSSNAGTTVLSAAPAAVARAAAVLAAGAIVAFPTDTVYGVAAALGNAEALRRLFAVKGRPAEKTLPVLLADRSQVGLVAAAVDPRAEALMARFWPGPLTIAVPARSDLPEAVVGPGTTVGVRVPDHPIARALIAAAGGALATTSANRSGAPAAVTAEEVVAQLGGAIELVLDGGATPGGVASTVVGMAEERLVVFREGAIAADEVLRVWRGAESDCL